MILEQPIRHKFVIPHYPEDIAEELFPYFPAFERDVKTADVFHGVYPPGIQMEDLKKIDPSAFAYEKLCTAIHEAGHIVAVLLSDYWDLHLIGSKIHWNWFKDDEGGLYYGLGGRVLFLNGVFPDDLISSMIDSAGVNAALSFGIPENDAWGGSADDIDYLTKNMLKNTKRIGGIDQSTLWSHQKNEYKHFMQQEAGTLFLYCRAIMDDNRKAIAAFAEKLYEKESLSAAELRDIASTIKINKKSYNSLISYIKEFYK